MATKTASVSNEIRTRISQKVERAAGHAADARRKDRRDRRKEKSRREYWRLGCDKVGIELTDAVASAIGYLWSLRSHSKRRATAATRPVKDQNTASLKTNAPQRLREEKQLPLFPGPQHPWKG